jgi:septal ring-binding cell division protein DamX
MSEARPFASLSSGLLARKGAAKPAMRPAAFQVGASLDDCGWNDKGLAHPEPVQSGPVAHAGLTPAPRGHDPQPHFVDEEPPVRDQQRVLAESFGASEEVEAPKAAAPAPAPAKPAARVAKAKPAEVVAIPVRRKGGASDKAAFTLRLDPERHFRLRLACAVTGTSAQSIVTGALDEILKTIPELDALAGRMPARRARRG